jgi:hypothetical protein
MAQLQIYALQNEKYKVFDGAVLHRNAWIKKGKVQKKHAAVVAGIREDQLKMEEAEDLIQRMTNVKRGFSGWMNHYMTTRWLDTASRRKLKNHQTNNPVETFHELLEELESNPRMESFLNWYHIVYKDLDARQNVKYTAEGEIMRELGLTYIGGSTTGTPTTGGCVGDLMLEVQGKLMEQMNNRSKQKQGLHVVKSRPTFVSEKNAGSPMSGSRRNIGDFYVVKSEPDGKPVEWTAFNVSN